MFASALIYFGLIATGIGAISVVIPLAFLGIRRRGSGLVLMGAGLAMVVVSVLLPAREVRVTTPRTQLDRFSPAYQFHEAHSVRIAAPKDRVYWAIRSVTADEIFLFRALTSMRRFGSPGPESILNAPEKMPLLDVATKTTFLLLAEEPGREIVVGTLVAAPRRWRPRTRPTPEDFRTLRDPGFALAAMNFLIEDAGPGACTVTTETRVYATDASSCRRFAGYWRVIYPGSALIRRMWLRAIKHRAASPPS
ncbi:MAG: hypothetical protein AAB113_09590 [Candidatus Eisenbacteria bacterium]